MAVARDSRGRFVSQSAKPEVVRDTLATFTAGLSGGIPGGFRDQPLQSGYAKDWQYHNNLYKTSWIARAAVETIPEDCFKRGYQWVAEPEQINLLEAEERRLNIRKKKKQALTWSRKDGEAYLYFDLGDDASQPLNAERVRQGGLRFVNALRMSDMSKGPIVMDPLSPLHGQPEYYLINQVSIHPSRVCRFVNGEDTDTGQGVSVLSYLSTVIMGAEEARNNTVALTTEALIDVLYVCDLMDRLSDPEQEAQITRKYSLMRQMKATNKMMVLDLEGEKFERKPSTFTTLPEVIETMRREVAAAIGIPYSLLFGRPGGLGTNGETELKNYYDNIATMQRNDIQPVCELLDECVIRSALGNRPEEVYIDWLSLYEMSDTEKATYAKTMADAAGVAVDKGIIPADVLTESLINSWVEVGAFQGIEQNYADWVRGGGTVDGGDDDQESDLPRPTDQTDSLMDRANAILDGS